MKICTKCKQIGEFSKDKTKKDGFHSICKKCQKISTKQYLKNNPDAHEKRKEVSRLWRANNKEKSKIAITNATLRSKYGISLDQYNEMLKKQNFSCAVCFDKPIKQRLHVDHCHATLKVRGLLCQACNTSIGKMKESPSLIRALANYVEEHQN